MTTIKFPVNIGDEVIGFPEEDNVREIRRYKVDGLMIRNGKHYAILEDGESFEIGREVFVPTVDRKTPTAFDLLVELSEFVCAENAEIHQSDDAALFTSGRYREVTRFADKLGEINRRIHEKGDRR